MKVFVLAVLVLATLGFSQTKESDIAVVREILDSAGWKDVTVQSVTVADSSGRIISLDLTNREMGKSGIKSLPPAIGTLTALKNLHLDRNDLTSIPTEMGFLRNLDTLDLQYNQLEELSATIGNLNSLKKLDLRSNQLSQLPSELFDLKSLKILKLSGNKLAFLPDEIGKLPALKELYLSGNRLTGIPKSILTKKTLTYVDFQDNKFCSPSPELAAWLKKWDDMWKSRQTCN